jgi:hypothetical protein
MDSLMSVKDLNYRAANGKANQTSSTRMISSGVWSECPWFELERGLKDGLAYFDDFAGNYVQAANVAAASTTLNDPWAAFTNATAGATIASGVSPADAVGTMVLATNTASEGVVVGLQTAKNTTAAIDALSATNRVWFEARIKTSSVAANRNGVAVGLGQVGRLVTLGQQASTSAIAAIDSITLFRAATGTTAIQTVIGNGTATVVNATAGTFAANTYTKLGFYWNGTTGTFYQDGAALTTTITSASTQFPATDALAFYVSVLGGSSASSELVTVDWVRVAFERTATSST